MNNTKKYIGKFYGIEIWEDEEYVYRVEPKTDLGGMVIKSREYKRLKKDKELLTCRPNIPEETDIETIVAVGNTLQLTVLLASISHLGIGRGYFYDFEDWENRDTLQHGYHEYYETVKDNTYKDFREKAKVWVFMGDEMLINKYEHELYEKLTNIGEI